MSKLYELLKDAEAKVRKYRRPKLDALRGPLNETLAAIGEGHTGDDEITGIYFDKDRVTISVSYSVRQCEQHNSFVIPLVVIKAADPVAAAKRYGLEKRKQKLTGEISFNKTVLARLEGELSKINEDIAGLPA